MCEEDFNASVLFLFLGDTQLCLELISISVSTPSYSYYVVLNLGQSHIRHYLLYICTHNISSPRHASLLMWSHVGFLEKTAEPRISGIVHFLTYVFVFCLFFVLCF